MKTKNHANIASALHKRGLSKITARATVASLPVCAWFLPFNTIIALCLWKAGPAKIKPKPLPVPPIPPPQGYRFVLGQELKWETIRRGMGDVLTLGQDRQTGNFKWIQRIMITPGKHVALRIGSAIELHNRP